MIILLLMGAPGSGKGTQSVYLSHRYNVPVVSTGDILRNELKDTSSSLGKTVRSFVDTGDLVPDKIIIDVVKKRLQEKDCASGFILDGYPRTYNQAMALDIILEELSLSITKVISLEVPDERLIERVLNRSKESLRTDDNELTIKKRLELFHEETKKTIDFYEKKRIVSFVDGSLEIENVKEAILRLL